MRFGYRSCGIKSLELRTAFASAQTPGYGLFFVLEGNCTQYGRLKYERADVALQVLIDVITNGRTMRLQPKWPLRPSLSAIETSSKK